MTLNEPSSGANTDSIPVLSETSRNHRAPDRITLPAKRGAQTDDRANAIRRRRGNQWKAFGLSAGRIAATSTISVIALLAAVLIWEYYVTTPWTRDGRVRVQVASIAPQVSGQITQVNVADNQFVHKGDILYVIDPFDFENALDQSRAQLAAKTADLQVKKHQAERRQALSELSTSVEEKQLTAGAATQAEGAFQAAQAQVQQAEINLGRTEVRSPVNGYVTNLLMRVGDYAHAGVTDLSVIDADSYWIDGYFEETKMPYICVGDTAEARLLGYDDPILGRVESITRGISVSNASSSTQGLPNVDPVYTWVRLAQRVPVRIKIMHVPEGVPLVSGLTATISIQQDLANGSSWLDNRIREAGVLLTDRLRGVHVRSSCLTGSSFRAPPETSVTPEPSKATNLNESGPGSAPRGVQVPTPAKASNQASN
jgi:multidrug resistance efflux pump